jgi:Tol biopolymer transport system component
VPTRALLVLVLIALLVAAAAVYIAGSRQRVPAPFGAAVNGSLAYTSQGDIFVQDSLTGSSRLLVGGPGDDAFPFFSPDGQLVGFSTTVDGNEYLKVANADGSNVRQVLDDPIVSAGAVWRPDSRAMAVDTLIHGVRRLLIVPIDGSPVTQLDLGRLWPTNVTWRPPSGDSLLFRGLDEGGSQDLYTINADGTGLRGLGLTGTSDFGADWTLGGATWSPDGRTIAFNSIERTYTDLNQRVSHFRVGLVSPEGVRSSVAGPTDAQVQEAWPAFSPDGKWILVHRWIFKDDAAFRTPEGWLAVMPADGSARTRDIGPRIPGGEDTGGAKTWSPDGTRVLLRFDNTQQVFSIDPVSGASELLPWTTELPDWQRAAKR